MLQYKYQLISEETPHCEWARYSFWDGEECSEKGTQALVEASFFTHISHHCDLHANIVMEKMNEPEQG